VGNTGNTQTTFAFWNKKIRKFVDPELVLGPL
jgi:hypothetical protein